MDFFFPWQWQRLNSHPLSSQKLMAHFSKYWLARILWMTVFDDDYFCRWVICCSLQVLPRLWLLMLSRQLSCYTIACLTSLMGESLPAHSPKLVLVYCVEWKDPLQLWQYVPDQGFYFLGFFVCFTWFLSLGAVIAGWLLAYCWITLEGHSLAE